MFTLSDDRSPANGITPIDPPARKWTFRAVMFIVALEPLVLFVILLAVGMPLWGIACIFAAGAALIGGIFWIITIAIWKPWQRRYPQQPTLPGAVSQSWQTFGFGVMARLNNCLTIVADEKHIHLQPFALLRLFGARTISLPLDRITDVKPSAMPAFGLSAKVDGRTISGPEWCLKLASIETLGSS